MACIARLLAVAALAALAVGGGGVWRGTIPSVWAQDRPQQGAPGPFGNDEFVGRLAQRLGIPTEQLATAIQQTVRETDARAGSRPAFIPPEPVLRLSVQILGIEPDALGQELQQGKSLAQIAAEHGVGPDAYADALVQAMEQLRVEQMRLQVRELIDKPIQQAVPPTDR